MDHSLVVSFMSHVAAANCQHQFLGFLPWNAYLHTDSNCQIVDFHLLGGDSSLLLILLAVIDDLFRAVGLLAVGFMIYAGVKFILSNGAPDEAAKARTTAINALVGIGISLVAISFVTFLGAKAGAGQGAIVGPFNLDLRSLPNPTGADNGGILQTALSLIFGVMGAIAFLVIVIAGMQYVFSQGDAQTASRARSTIIYALIGLVIAVVAQSVVSFVIHFHTS